MKLLVLFVINICLIDPIGRPIITASSDHCHTCLSVQNRAKQTEF